MVRENRYLVQSKTMTIRTAIMAFSWDLPNQTHALIQFQGISQAMPILQGQHSYQIRCVTLSDLMNFPIPMRRLITQLWLLSRSVMCSVSRDNLPSTELYRTVLYVVERWRRLNGEGVQIIVTFLTETWCTSQSQISQYSSRHKRPHA